MREEKFDSYCLFHVALDATLFKMFRFHARVRAQHRRVWVRRPGCLALRKGEGRVRDHFNPIEGITLNLSPSSSPREKGERRRDLAHRFQND
jgi:hypothetical protein